MTDPVQSVVNELKNKRSELLSNYLTQEDILNNHHHAYKMIEFGKNSEIRDLLEWLEGIILKYDTVTNLVTYSLANLPPDSQLLGTSTWTLVGTPGTAGSAITPPASANPSRNEFVAGVRFTVPTRAEATIVVPDGYEWLGWHPNPQGTPLSLGRLPAALTGVAPLANSLIMPNGVLTLHAWFREVEEDDD
jgi:hypothetical protein